MHRNPIFYFSFAIVLGIAMFIFGGYDDSPGAQLLGVFMTGLGIASIVKYRKLSR